MSKPFQELENQIFSTWAFGQNGEYRQEHLPLGYWKPSPEGHVSDDLETAAWSLVVAYDNEATAKAFESHGDFAVEFRIKNANAAGDTITLPVSIPWRVMFDAWEWDNRRMAAASIYASTHDAYGKQIVEYVSVGEYLADAMGFGRQ